MSGFFGAAFWFVVTLSVLVTFHELGHFWVARRFGIRVLRFSIGFGKPLWSRVAKDGTRWQVATFPLGGYVQFLDEREQEVAPAERESAFNRKPAWQRILVVLAGPFANLLLCVALFWVALQLGRPELAPVLGETRGIAAEAGLVAGDRLVAVAGVEVDSWDGAMLPLALAAIDREPLTVAVLNAKGVRREALLRLDRLGADFDQADPLGAMGLSGDPTTDLPLVGAISPGFPAEGQLQVGDRILSVGGQPVSHFSQIRSAMRVAAANGATVAVEFERAGNRGRASIQPRQVETPAGMAWQLGIAPG